MSIPLVSCPAMTVDICGLNARCFIPERSTLPTAKEVLRSYPLRGTSEALSGFSLDIKSAHKRIVLHPTERGLVGFSLNGDIYFYNVTPFGATFQQHGGLDWVVSSSVASIILFGGHIAAFYM